MRTQAQQHQGFGLRQTRWGKAVLLLKLFHGVTRRRTPDAIRFVVEEAGLSERILDFPHSRRLDAHVKVMVVAPVVPSMPAHVRRARAVRPLLLLCRQPDIRHQERRQGNKHGQTNSAPAMGGNLHLFHINAEYQPETWS